MNAAILSRILFLYNKNYGLEIEPRTLNYTLTMYDYDYSCNPSEQYQTKCEIFEQFL